MDFQDRERNQADARQRLLDQFEAPGTPDSHRVALKRESALVAPLGRDMSATEALVGIRKLSEATDSQVTCHRFIDQRSGQSFQLTDGTRVDDVAPGYMVFPEATIVKEGFLLHKDYLYLDTQAHQPYWPDGHEGDQFYNELPFRAYCKADRTAVVDAPHHYYDKDVFLFNMRLASHNIAHQVMDTLMGLYSYNLALGGSGVSNISCYIPAGWIYPLQEVLIDDLFRAENGAGLLIKNLAPGRYRNVIVPVPQFPIYTADAGFASAKFMRARLMQLAARCRSELGIDAPEKIFVSRSDARSTAYGRSEIDYGLLEERFIAKGYVPVVNSTLSPAQQMATYSCATHVAGVHGAGLMSAFFSSARDLTVIEIDPPVRAWTAIERLMRAAGVGHVLIEPERDSGAVSYAAAVDHYLG